jgi:lipopolysaccharide export system ATP-binding protein
MTQTHTLAISNVCKAYKKRMVVDSISLKLHSNEIVGLLGPNGAGKTTLFYLIVGLIPVNKGQIWFDQINITGLAIHQRARIGLGYLPQEASIFRKLSVADNILAILQLRKDLNKAERKDKLEYLLDTFHIAHIRNAIGISLSGGERRRVEIARALAMEPKFILLDEPFAGIDPISIIDIKGIIKQLCQSGIGILITDHNVREALDICHRAYIVNDGHILAEGPSQMIADNKKVREVYLGNDFNL